MEEERQVAVDEIIDLRLDNYEYIITADNNIVCSTKAFRKEFLADPDQFSKIFELNEVDLDEIVHEKRSLSPFGDFFLVRHECSNIFMTSPQRQHCLTHLPALTQHYYACPPVPDTC